MDTETREELHLAVAPPMAEGRWRASSALDMARTAQDYGVEIVTADGAVAVARLSALVFEVLEHTSTRCVYSWRGFVPGTPVNVRLNVYVWDNDSTARLELFVGFGGTTIAKDQVSHLVQAIGLVSPHAMFVDRRRQIGASDPAQRTDGTWQVTLSGRRAIGRGERLPFRGWIVPFPMGTGETLAAKAMAHGQVIRVSAEWAGHYSTQGQVPRLDRATLLAMATRARDGSLSDATRRGDLYDQRPLGLAKYAGQTGAQDDFGVAQDAQALSLPDPRRVEDLLASLDGYWLRPFHNVDDRCLPIRFREHPEMRTWSQVPERRVGSRDQVGWPESLPYVWPASGYSGIDDQHRSQELVTCLAHLVDSFELDQLLLDFVQVDLAQAMVWQDRTDSPRAEGRCLSAWADMLGLVDEASELQAHATRRLQVLERHWVGRNLPDAAVRPLLLGTSPELAGGHGTPAVVVWEHCIAAMGLWDWFRRTADLTAERLCRITCEMIVEHGMFREGEAWWCVQAMRWAGGAALQASSYGPRTADVAASRSEEWWAWTLPAALILAHAWPASRMAGKARMVLAEVYRDGPRTEMQAEWWAVVPHRDWAAAAAATDAPAPGHVEPGAAPADGDLAPAPDDNGNAGAHPEQAAAAATEPSQETA